MLLHHFTKERLAELSSQLRPQASTGLQYYPLLARGERFPCFDPLKEPCLEPRPADDAVFLQGMLEGMADIEATAYRCLAVHRSVLRWLRPALLTVHGSVAV